MRPPEPTDRDESHEVGGFVPIVGHGSAGAAHVVGEMQAHVLANPAASEPGLDPIVAMLHQGQYRDALAACARAHARVLGRLCMALLGSQADADEATQETLLRAHRAMPTYRGLGTIKAWLCGIARHVCAHVLETRRKGREFAELVILPDEASDEFAIRQRARAVRLALGHLKPSERDVLVLRFVADLSHREIAIACNLDEAAARKRISRALARLRAVMPGDAV